MWSQMQAAFLDAISRIAQALGRLLPGVLAMALLVLLSALLALGVRSAVRRLFERLGVDRRLREWGMAAPAAAGLAPPSHTLGRVAAWTVVALGFLVGLSVLETSTTSELSARLLAWLPNALVGGGVLAAGVAGSRALERSILIEAVNLGLPSARLLGLGARWMVVVLAAAMALEQVGIGGSILTAAFAILFGGIVLTLTLAVGLGARDFVARSLERRPSEPEPKQEPPPPTKLHHL